MVCFCGPIVRKFQRADAWVPKVSESGKLEARKATPREYLRRLTLQNEMFGDEIRIIGLTRGNRFVTTQPTLCGGEPSEIEIRDMLEGVGWERVPMGVQELPHVLMGSAWWHPDENLILLDARKPNFKITQSAVLPIDLVIADLPPDHGFRWQSD